MRLLPELYSLSAIVLNVVLRLVPTRVKAAIAATAIKAAINAYSMAVTPDWPLTKFVRNLRNGILLRSTKGNHAEVAARSLSNGKEPSIFLYTSITRALNYFEKSPVEPVILGSRQEERANSARVEYTA